jgi:hypothetical protein
MPTVYKLVNGVLFKDDKAAFCPEKGVVAVSYIEEPKVGLDFRNQKPQVKTNMQYFYCMENCAKFVKESVNGSINNYGHLACCGAKFIIDSEETTGSEKKDLTVN